MKSLRRWIVIMPLMFAACAATTSNEVMARRGLGDELVRRGEWQLGFEVVDRLCRENPDDAYALMLRGMIYTEQRLLPEAEADLKDATRLEPKLAKAHAALGILYDIERRPDEALAEHRRAVELEPRNPGFLNNLGFSLFASGKARDAIPVLHEALRAAPTDARVRNNLGFAYAAAGEFGLAAEQFGIAGTPAQAKNNLGWAYERKGSLVQAFDQYAEAVRMDPAADAPRRNLERVAEALHRPLPTDVPATPSRS